MTDDLKIEGYASLFWTRDLNDDVTAAGAFADSLADGAPVIMLHQHDEAEPVGVWDAVVEDAKGLFVRGRILRTTPRGRLVAALVEAGALDGLSIGFRQVKARTQGRLRVLSRVELWEVSIVTFPRKYNSTCVCLLLLTAMPASPVLPRRRATPCGVNSQHLRLMLMPMVSAWTRLCATRASPRIQAATVKPGRR